MARSRSLPTALLEDPDYFERSSATQSILIALVLTADDEGRGLAHVGLLARKFNKEIPFIEQALHELQACEMLVCYQVGRHRYYSLTRWQEWETLSKPTPSKYPAPPPTFSTGLSQESPTCSQPFQENPGNPREPLPEDEEEGEDEEKRSEGEEEPTPPNVVTFPSSRSDSGSAVEHQIPEATRQVAAILKLTVTPALIRIVEDYLHDSTLSLLGEADAAREWIDDRQRNRKGQRMTPAFFRRWLKREQEDVLHRQAARLRAQATGTTGKYGSGPPTGVSLPKSLMHLEEAYHASTTGKQQGE